MPINKQDVAQAGQSLLMLITALGQELERTRQKKEFEGVMAQFPNRPAQVTGTTNFTPENVGQPFKPLQFTEGGRDTEGLMKALLPLLARPEPNVPAKNYFGAQKMYQDVTKPELKGFGIEQDVYDERTGKLVRPGRPKQDMSKTQPREIDTFTGTDGKRYTKFLGADGKTYYDPPMPPGVKVRVSETTSGGSKNAEDFFIFDDSGSPISLDDKVTGAEKQAALRNLQIRIEQAHNQLFDVQDPLYIAPPETKQSMMKYWQDQISEYGKMIDVLKKSSTRNKQTGSPQRKVVRTGRDKTSGKKVIQYDDGTIEYAE